MDKAETLISSLLEIRRSPSDTEELTTTLRAAILRYGSATPDNQSCVEHIEVGLVPHPASRPEEVLAIKLSGRPWSLASVVNALESIPLPQFVADEFPEITQSELQACLRVATLMLTLFENWSQDASGALTP